MQRDPPSSALKRSCILSSSTHAAGARPLPGLFATTLPRITCGMRKVSERSHAERGTGTHTRAERLAPQEPEA